MAYNFKRKQRAIDGNYMKKLVVIMVVFIIPILVIAQADDYFHPLHPPLSPLSSYSASTPSPSRPLSPSNDDGYLKKSKVICPPKCFARSLVKLARDKNRGLSPCTTLFLNNTRFITICASLDAWKVKSSQGQNTTTSIELR